MTMRVAIIGGGWAGLAAAVELSQLGVPITLFEAGRELGGRARRAPQLSSRLGQTLSKSVRPEPVEGLASQNQRLLSENLLATDLDNGQHILLGAYHDTLALMQQVGADPDRCLQRLPLKVWDDRGFRLSLPALPPPLNLAWGLCTAQGVSRREKLATALWMQGLKRRQFQLPQDQSVADWLDQAGQNGVLRQRLWEPLCLAALNTPIQVASAQIFAQVLRDSLGSPTAGATDLLLPRGSLSDLLPDPAADWLSQHGARLQLRRRVRQLTARSQGEQAGWQVEGENFAAVILATAPQHLAALLPAPTPDSHWALPAFEYQPIGTVYFRYPAQVSLPFPLMALAEGPGQWLVDRGQGVLAASLSGHGDWEQLTQPQLAAALHAQICHFIGPQALPPYLATQDLRATFACTPGLRRYPQHTPWPGLWLAGDHCWADYPATLEGAVRSGRHAARLCYQSLAS